MIPVKDSSPVLISNGMEEVARFHLTSNFVINADEDGEIIDYDEESKMILVPVNNPQDDIEGFVEYIKDEYIFGLDTCIGDPYGFTYDPDRELISIPADFSNLNAEYPKY